MHLRMYVERGMYACIVPSLNYFLQSRTDSGGAASPHQRSRFYLNITLMFVSVAPLQTNFFNFSVEACPDLVMLRGPPSANPGSVPVCIGVIVHYGPLRYGV